MRNAFYPFLLALSGHYTTSAATGSGTDLKYANHIFNAVHDSMRQWGSSLNHNGVSAFIATVPVGTEFYHGTSSPYRINGTEWLAFEPEHALLFARGPRRPPPGRGGPPGRHSEQKNEHRRSKDQNGKRHGSALEDHGSLDEASVNHEASYGYEKFLKDVHKTDRSDRRYDSSARKGQLPLSATEQDTPEPPRGYLHTYVTKKPLRLLYVDGQSGAKSRKGTLDMQDVVILQLDLSSISPVPGQPRHGPMGEYERAVGMCNMASEEWNGQIDGILRMEGGFEIILCSFQRDLEVKSIEQMKAAEQDEGPGNHGRDGANMLEYYQAVAARYDGIGGNRVQLDYEDFVTVFASPDALYFDAAGFPRVHNASADLDLIRADIARIASRRRASSGTDWQAVSDMIVSRYADRIEHLTTGDFQTFSAYRAVTDRAMRPFVDYRARNATQEIARCTTQLIPSTADTSSLAAQALLQVTLGICSTLSAVSSSHDFESSQQRVQDLRAWLGWTTWKKCRGCTADEVCFLPIWPAGSKEDLEKPKCKSAMDDRRGGYWEGFGPHGMKGEKEEEH